MDSLQPEGENTHIGDRDISKLLVPVRLEFPGTAGGTLHVLPGAWCAAETIHVRVRDIDDVKSAAKVSSLEESIRSRLPESLSTYRRARTGPDATSELVGACGGIEG